MLVKEIKFRNPQQLGGWKATAKKTYEYPNYWYFIYKNYKIKLFKNFMKERDEKKTIEEEHRFLSFNF